jgi:hypothetical protein
MKDAHLLSDSEIEMLTHDQALSARDDLHSWHGFGYSDGRTAAQLMDNPKLFAEVIRARYAVDKRLFKHSWQRLRSRCGVPRIVHIKHIRKAQERGETIPVEVLEQYQGEL